MPEALRWSLVDYAGYTITSGVTGSGVDVVSDGVEKALVLRGTAAEINAYLAGLQFGSANDPNTVLKLEVVVDDRTYSGATPLSDANGGAENQNQAEGGAPVAVSTGVFDPYDTQVSAFGGYNLVSKSMSLRISTEDEVPTVSVPATQTVDEDVRTTILGISVGDPESEGFGTNVTVTLTVGSGKLNVGSLTGVTVSGNGTSTITLTGTADKIDTLLGAGVDYTSAADNNTDNNGAAAGDATLTVTITEGASAIGNEAGGDPGSDSTSASFAIAVTPVNDAPVVSQSGSAIAVSDPLAPVSVDGFSVADKDISGDAGNLTVDEQNFVQVTVRLLDENGNPLAVGSYAGVVLEVAANGGLVIDGTLDGTNAALQIRGTLAEVNTALAGLKLTLGSTLGDADHPYKVQVVADDRIRDLNTGVLDSSGIDANGGEQNNSNGGTSAQAVPTTELNAYSGAVPAVYNLAAATRIIWPSSGNEAPTVGKSSAATVNEDIRTFVGGDFTITDTESDNFGLKVRVTLSTGGNGTLGVGGATAQNGSTLSSVTVVSGDETGTLVLEGTAGDIEALLNNATNGLHFTSAADDNSDHNGAAAGDVTVTVTIDEYQAATTFGMTPQTASASFGIAVTPVNDAPVVSQSGSAIAVSDPLAPVSVDGFSVADKDISGDAGNLAAGEQDFMQVTVRLLDENGNPLAAGSYAGMVLEVAANGGLVIDGTLDGTDAALQIRGTLAEVNTALAGLKLTLGHGLGNADYPYKVQVVADDRIRDLNTGVLDSSGIDANGGEQNNSNGSTSAQAVPTTELNAYSGAVPAVYNLAAATRLIWANDLPSVGKSLAETVNEDIRTFVGGDFAIADTESDDSGLKVRVTLSTGGNGVLSIGGSTAQNGSTISNVTVVSGDETGTLVLEGTASDIEALLNNATNGLHFTSAADDNGDHNGAAAGDVTVTVTIDEYQAAATFGVTPQTASTSFTITVNPVNDAPVLAGTSLDPTARISSSGAGTTTVALVTGASASDVDLADAGVSSFGGGTLTIHFTDGYQPGDRLTLAGSPAGVASVAGGSGNDLVVTLTADATAADVKAIIEALRYRSVDADPTNGNTDTSRAFSIVLNDGNNDDGASHNAGGPAALNSNALTGIITLGFTLPEATDNAATVVRNSSESDSGNLLTDDDGAGVDSDPEADPLTVTDVDGTAVPGTGSVTVTGTYGTLTVAADGSYTYQLDPANPAVAALAGSDTLAESFTYAITDGNRTDSAQLVVTIKAPPAPPAEPPVVVTPIDTKPPVTPPTEPAPPAPPPPTLYTPPSVVTGPPPATGTNIGNAVGLGGDRQPGPSELRGFADRPMEYARTWGGERPSDWDLMLVGSVSNRFIIPNQPSAIEVPPNIFRHTNPNEPLAFEASRPDGSPLPKWLSFDARNLTFRGVPPDSAKGAVDIVITAKDTKGNKAEAQFRILVGQNVGEGMPVQDGTRPPQQGAEGEPQRPGPEQQGRADEGEGWDASLTVGRSAFSTQLREAGRMGVLAQARALLDAIRQPGA
ncbi:MAG: VCBS domain-containing protein [Magnetospirillum sp.]|nr:VCBS domain-containing protein [Magnetospirillum sp.]